tara:strand:+ start:72011 stop:72604 length:594 start_codon:yes stop_codon:yes gene_type:complete
MFSTKLSKGMFSITKEDPGSDFKRLNQIHSNIVMNSKNIQETPQEADGMVSFWNESPIKLAIKTADCLPIVMIGKNGVAHLHAGWRGLSSKIYQHKLIEEIEPIEYYIGPHIKDCCFEVQSDFLANFPNDKELFLKKNDKIYFSLTKKAQKDLEYLYPKIKGSIAKECTCCAREFFSYRRDATAQRNWNLYQYTSNL